LLCCIIFFPKDSTECEIILQHFHVHRNFAILFRESTTYSTTSV